MNANHKYSRKKRLRRQRRHTIKMTCSPAVKKISVKNSCYTPRILFMIRDAYNQDHPNEKRIDETDPTKLWKILNDLFVHCRKEDCWLNEIKDANLKKRIDRYIFAPDKPYEWKKDPNAWLSNFDIMNVLEQYESTYKHFEFIGPTSIDFDKVINGKNCVYNELCQFQLSDHIKRGKTHIGIIFNLSPHDKDGSHWVSLYIDVKERIIFFFDSAGAKMPEQIETFVNRVKQQAVDLNGVEYTLEQNWPNDHQMGSTECGVYSLFFIITMLTSVAKMSRGKMSMRQKLHLFKERKIPDKYIEKYRNVYFND